MFVGPIPTIELSRSIATGDSPALAEALLCINRGFGLGYASRTGFASQRTKFRELVHRLTYNGDVAAGQLAVFQGGPSRTGGKAPISESYGSNEQRGKTANRPWPRRVAFKMGRGRVARRLRIDSDMRSRALPTTHFERNGITIICETVR